MARNPQTKIEITGDSKGAERAIRSTQAAIGRLGADLGKVQALASRALNFAGIGGSASVAGLIAVTKRVADLADQMGKLAERTGDTTEDLSKLAYAARLNDLEFGTLRDGLRNLSGVLTDMAEGRASKATETLADLGIAARNTDGSLKTAGQAVREIAGRLEGMEDGAKKTSILMEVLGRNVGEKFVPLINQGAAGLARFDQEAQKLGAVISADLARKSAELNDNIERLKTAAEAAGVSIGSQLIGPLNAVVEAIVQIRMEQDSLNEGQTLEDWAYASARGLAILVDGLDAVGRTLDILGRGIGAYAAMATQAAQGNLAAAREIYGFLSSDVERTLGRQLFSQRLQAQIDRQRTDSQQRRAQAQADENDQGKEYATLQRRYLEEEARLRDLQGTRESGLHRERLKNLEQLRDAQSRVWQEAQDGARRANEEAASLFERAEQVRQGYADRAQDRRMRGMSDEDREAIARREARRLTEEARRAALAASLEATDGRTANAQRLAKQAEEAAKRAASFVDRIGDDRIAARLFDQLGEAESRAVRALAQIQQAEAAKQEAKAQELAAKIEENEARIAKLREALQEPVKIDADIAEAESNLERLQAQLDAMKDKTVTVTVRTLGTDAGGRGFASGGYTGPGGKYKPAGVVHAGEYVLRREVVKQPGMLALLNEMNRRGLAGLSGYATGGLVGAGASGASAGTPVNLYWPDGRMTPMRADPKIAEEVKAVFRQARLSVGSRK